MDALPIKEENDVPYKSLRDGVMHACGHDVHTTCLLGAARILSELKDEWEGTVKLIFQPGEERNPGGASIMIKEGVLEHPKPQAIFGLHVHPGLATGRLSFRGGMVMASADELYFTIKGKGDTLQPASHCRYDFNCFASGGGVAAGDQQKQEPVVTLGVIDHFSTGRTYHECYPE